MPVWLQPHLYILLYVILHSKSFIFLSWFKSIRHLRLNWFLKWSYWKCTANQSKNANYCHRFYFSSFKFLLVILFEKYIIIDILVDFLVEVICENMLLTVRSTPNYFYCFSIWSKFNNNILMTVLFLKLRYCCYLYSYFNLILFLTLAYWIW